MSDLIATARLTPAEQHQAIVAGLPFGTDRGWNPREAQWIADAALAKALWWVADYLADRSLWDEVLRASGVERPQMERQNLESASTPILLEEVTS